MGFEMSQDKELKKQELNEQITRLEIEIQKEEERKRRDEESRKQIAESLGQKDIPYKYGDTTLLELKQRLIELKKEKEMLEKKS